jgi:hypothetical protein
MTIQEQIGKSRQGIVKRIPFRAPTDHPLSIEEPIILLGTPQSFNSLVGAMLGQHPELYDLPETHLLGFETVGQWHRACPEARFRMADGLLRAVAQVCFGGQTDAEVNEAVGWLRRRFHFTSGYLLEELAERIHPRILIEKSPSLVSDPTALVRVREMFPLARFLHLVQHPRSFGRGLTDAVSAAAAAGGPVPPWLLHLACFPHRFADDEPDDLSAEQSAPEPDPQRAWYALHRNACSFLESVPEMYKRRVRVEDVVSEPGRVLADVCRWLKVRDDEEAVEQMMHPERSPFARVGPSGAPFGNDPTFLENPTFPQQVKNELATNLDDPLPWRRDGTGLATEVKELACEFGYE